MTTDGLVFVGESHFGLRSCIEDVRAEMDRLEVERTVLCPVYPAGGDWSAANDAVAKWRAERPGRHLGLARVDPNLGDRAVAEARRALDQLDLDGIYLDPWEERFSLGSSIVDQVGEVAARYGRPITVASGFPWASEPLQVADFARRHSSVPIVATHGGNINISGLSLFDIELAMREVPNLHLLTNGVYREDFLTSVVHEHGPSRLMYASAFPVTNMELELKRVLWAGWDEDTLGQILEGQWASWAAARAE